MKKTKLSVVALFLIVCALICVVFAGCGTDYQAIYNDDASIISYNGRFSASSQVKNVYTKEAYVSCGSFSGVETLYLSFEVNNEVNADLTIDYKNETGKLKLVLTGNDNVYTLAEVGLLDSGFVGQTSGKLNFNGIPNGDYRLKIVGFNAAFSLNLKFA